MSDFQNALGDFIKSLNTNEIGYDKCLICLNQFLGENCESISKLEHPKKSTEQSKQSIANIARKFPVVWCEKDTHNHIQPKFEKNIYVEYLSNINNSYKNLPLPNYNPLFKLNDLPNFNKNWHLISVDEFTNELMDKQGNGRDFYKLSYENFQKVVSNFPEIAEFIVDGYNDILSGDYNLCQEWCSANICSRFKGGDKTDPKRFRPLMVLPLIVRIMDTILCKKLHNIILDYNVIDTRVQKAILKNSNGLWENVFDVNMRIKKMIDNNDDKLFLFIDLVNAFGCVNYRTMLTILQKYNFSPEFSNYFQRYYKNVFGVYKDESFKWTNGLFQGSALSNILFLLYIDFATKNLFQDMKALQIVPQEYDLQDNSFAFVDDMVTILPKNEKNNEQIAFFIKFMKFYGFTINTEKTYFVINDQTVDTLTFGNISFKKANKDYKYLGHCLFIFQNEVMNDIYQKLEKTMMTIDSFNIQGSTKAYIYYTNIFLRITRILETFYLINGKTPEMEQIFKEVSYYMYRWNMKDFAGYTKRHLEYIFSHGSNKICKSPNLQEYTKLIKNIENNNKYGVSDSIDDKNQNFTNLIGTDTPELETMERDLGNLRKNNYFPIEHYEKCGSSFYADNFVSWTE